MQHELEKSGYRGMTLGGRHGWRFIHYGQFAKNKSLNGWALGVYLLIRQLGHNGLLRVHGSEYYARLLAEVGNMLFNDLRLERFDRERLRLLTYDESVRLGYCPNSRSIEAEGMLSCGSSGNSAYSSDN
ncbi:hypothetical protein KBY90_02520 [Cyanobium sp. CH-040]|nr:hypothetical protein [Cyanobium sp. CH-040]